MNRRLFSYHENIHFLKNDNELFVLDSKGRPIAKRNKFSNILQSITFAY